MKRSILVWVCKMSKIFNRFMCILLVISIENTLHLTRQSTVLYIKKNRGSFINNPQASDICHMFRLFFFCKFFKFCISGDSLFAKRKWSRIVYCKETLKNWIEKKKKKKKVDCISTWDFFNLYVTILHDQLKSRICIFIMKSFSHGNNNYINLSCNRAYFVASCLYVYKLQ